MSDSDIIARMLYYCEEPRLPSQIMSYCKIDRGLFTKFSGHCLKRGLLAVRPASEHTDLFALVTTAHGRKVLSTADSILSHLGLDQDDVDKALR